MKTSRINKAQQSAQRGSDAKLSDAEDAGMETSTISKLERRRRIEDLAEERRLRQESSVF